MEPEEIDVLSDPAIKPMRNVLSRLPCASLVAFIMCVGGIVVFSACLYEAVDYLVTRFEIGIVGQIVWLVMVVHIVLALFFLVVATLSTGRTRRQTCGQCLAFNLIGRCCHILCIVLAYILHLVWFFLPAILILPVALLTAFVILCQIVPDCINLSDYGLPPDIADKVNPNDIIQTLKGLNKSEIEKYISKAEVVLDSAIDAAENSPFLENILSTIETNVPEESEINKFVNNIVNRIDVDKISQVIDQIQGGVDKTSDKLNLALDQLAERADGLHFNLDNLDTHNDTFEKLSYKVDNGTREFNLTNPLLPFEETSQNKTLQEMRDINETNNGETIANVSSGNIGRFIKKRDARSNGSGVTNNADTPDGADKNIDKRNELITNTMLAGNNSLADIEEELLAVQRAIQAAGESVDRARNDTQITIEAAKAEAEEIIRNVTEEATKSVVSIQREARELVETTKQSGAMTLNEVNDTARVSVDAAKREVQQAMERVETAKAEAQQMLNDVKDKEEDTIEAVRKEAKRLVDSAISTANKAKENAKSVQAEAEKLVRETQAQVANDVEKAKEKANKTIEDAKELAKETITVSKEKAQELIQFYNKRATKAVENAKLEADKIIAHSKRKVKNIAESVQSKIEELGQHGRNMTEDANKLAVQVAEDIKRRIGILKNDIDTVKTNVEQTARDAAEKVKKFSENTIKELSEMTKELIEKSNRYINQLTKTAGQIKQDAELLVREIVKDAQIMADKAQLVAKVAAKEAESALKKATEAAKAVARELDKNAKALAVQAEKEARRAAEIAQRAATMALQRAKEAVKNVRSVISAAANGTTKAILEAASNVRYYSQEAFKVARVAANEAAKGIRKAAAIFDVARVEIIKGFEMMSIVADKLGIERTGQDQFCSEAKVVYCQEIAKAHYHMIFVFISSVFINLSMVHFLMAMTANYVHVKRELRASARRQQLKDYALEEATAIKEDEQQPNLPKYDFTMSETGSFISKV